MRSCTFSRFRLTEQGGPQTALQRPRGRLWSLVRGTRQAALTPLLLQGLSEHGGEHPTGSAEEPGPSKPSWYLTLPGRTVPQASDDEGREQQKGRQAMLQHSCVVWKGILTPSSTLLVSVGRIIITDRFVRIKDFIVTCQKTVLTNSQMNCVYAEWYYFSCGTVVQCSTGTTVLGSPGANWKI